MKTQLTLQQLLALMVVFAIFAICVAGAFRGNHVAHGLLWGAAFFALPILSLCLFYWVTYAIYFILGREDIQLEARPNPAYEATEATKTALQNGPADEGTAEV